MPGTSFSTSARPSFRKAGTEETGTETSCLMEPPAGICASTIASRMNQSSLACPSLAAMVASVTISSSKAAARISSIASPMPESFLPEVISVRTYQSDGLSSGSFTPSTYSKAKSSA